jgi:hypothetical protein
MGCSGTATAAVYVGSGVRRPDGRYASFVALVGDLVQTCDEPGRRCWRSDWWVDEGEDEPYHNLQVTEESSGDVELVLFADDAQLVLGPGPRDHVLVRAAELASGPGWGFYGMPDGK